MAEEPTKCNMGINSIASLELPRREIVKFRDLIDYLESSMSALERDQADLLKRMSEAAHEAERLETLFESLFGEYIRGVAMAEVAAESPEERLRIERVPQITLGISEVTREHIQSVMDTIKRVSDEYQGPASREAVEARAAAIGISGDDFDDILARLRRAGALIESGGSLKLI
jgi:hypothetical protein